MVMEQFLHCVTMCTYETKTDAESMANSTTLTIRVDQKVKDRLAAVAKQQKRSKSFVAIEAIEEYLSVQEWQEHRIREAIEAADRGELIPHEEIMAWISSWETDNELPMPTPKV